MKLILKYLKKIIIAGFLLYAYNLIAVTFQITIPINIFTIIIVGFLDIPGIFGLIILKLVGW